MTPEFWEAQFNSDAFTSILNLMHYKVSPFETNNASESNHFDIFTVNSVKDLCGYWNSRALRESVSWSRDEIGRRTLLMPKQYVHEGRVKELLEFIRKKHPHASLSCNLHIWLHSWDEGLQKQLLDILAKCPGTEPSKEEKVTRSRRFSSAPLIVESFEGRNLT